MAERTGVTTSRFPINYTRSAPEFLRPERRRRATSVRFRRERVERSRGDVELPARRSSESVVCRRRRRRRRSSESEFLEICEFVANRADSSGDNVVRPKSLEKRASSGEFTRIRVDRVRNS